MKGTLYFGATKTKDLAKELNAPGGYFNPPYKATLAKAQKAARAKARRKEAAKAKRFDATRNRVRNFGTTAPLACQCAGRCDPNYTEGIRWRACEDENEVIARRMADGSDLVCCYPCYAEIEYLERGAK